MISSEMKTLNDVCNQQQLVELRIRNEARVKEMIRSMGKLHLLHPSNKVVKQAYKGVLSSR